MLDNVEPYEEGDGGDTPRLERRSRSYDPVSGQELGLDGADGDLSGLITSRSRYSDRSDTPYDPLRENDRFEREVYASTQPHSSDDAYDRTDFGYDQESVVRNPINSHATTMARLRLSSLTASRVVVGDAGSGSVELSGVARKRVGSTEYSHVASAESHASNQHTARSDADASQDGDDVLEYEA